MSKTNMAVLTFWANFGKFWATFYLSVWSPNARVCHLPYLKCLANCRFEEEATGSRNDLLIQPHFRVVQNEFISPFQKERSTANYDSLYLTLDESYFPTKIFNVPI